MELETGCGIIPYRYKEQGGRVRAAVGGRPGAVSPGQRSLAGGAVHRSPNGGSFESYPALIQLLMDRTCRDEELKRVNQRLLAGSALADGLSREYTLNEIAIITRAGPARLLGLRARGISVSAPTPT